jgi:hypothetical protein
MNRLLGHHLLDPDEVAGGAEVKPNVKPEVSSQSGQLSAPRIIDSDDDSE